MYKAPCRRERAQVHWGWSVHMNGLSVFSPQIHVPVYNRYIINVTHTNICHADTCRNSKESPGHSLWISLHVSLKLPMQWTEPLHNSFPSHFLWRRVVCSPNQERALEGQYCFSMCVSIVTLRKINKSSQEVWWIYRSILMLNNHAQIPFV